MMIFDFNQLLSERRFADQKCVVSIGVFDGLHRGHVQVIEKASALARSSEGTKLAVITFSANPKMMVGQTPYTPMLLSPRQRIDFLTGFGVDYLVVIDFSPEFSKLSGEAFIAKTCNLFQIEAIVVGENFRCGSQAATGVTEMREILPRYAKHGQLVIPPTYRLEDGSAVSSTLVRNTLARGCTSRLSELLGRNYELDLAQVPPKSSDEGLTFPHEAFVQLLPPPGVYAATLKLKDERSFAVEARFDSEGMHLRDESVRYLESRQNKFDTIELIKELFQQC